MKKSTGLFLAIVLVISMLLPATQPADAMPPAFDFSSIDPYWGESVTKYRSSTTGETTVYFSSDELCGRPDDLMGYNIYVTNNATGSIAVYTYALINGTYATFTSAGPVVGILNAIQDNGYGYYLSNPPQYAWPKIVSNPPLGTNNSYFKNMLNDNGKYTDSIRVIIGAWGTGNRTANITVVGLCSNTGTAPTPTPAPECDESDLTCKLRHYWPMDELGDNPDRLDHMGGATLQATQVVGGNDVPGTEYSKFGAGAAQFTGDSFLLSKTSPETLSITTEGWSIAGWIRPQGTGGSTQLTSKSSEYSIITTADNKISFTAGSTTITSANPITMDAWHLVSVIYDGSAYSLQVDAETPVAASGSAPSAGPGPIIYGDPFNGRLDEWHIWERAITSDQRDTLWNNGDGCFYPWYGGCNPRGLDTLLDGGMEQYPESTGWVMDSGADDFAMRVNRNTLVGWIQFTTIGPSRCGDGYHHLRTDVATPEEQPISQIFTWLGGDFYWKVSTRGMRGLFGSVISPDLQPRSLVKMVDVFSNTEYILVDDPESEPQTGNWKVNGGSITGLPESNYKIILGSYNGRTVDYDDVAIGTGPLDESCTEKLEPTATPTQPTQYVTATHSGAATLTDTPGPTPTPSSLLISNCGFEVSNAGWVLNSQSYIHSVGGPIGPMYLVAQSSPPGAYQTVWVGSATTVYLTSYVRSYAQIRLVNQATDQIVVVYSAYTSSWTQIRRTAELTAGYWKLELNASSVYSAGHFDGVDLAVNGYKESGFCVNTPTPGPTAFVNPTNTPTRTPTNAPTNTAVVITATLGSTKTPYGTPGDSGGPYTSTPGPAQLTSTANWIGTATEAAGTIGTLTPGPTSTPGDGSGDPWMGGDMPPVATISATYTSGGVNPIPGESGPPGYWVPGDGDGELGFIECERPVNPWSIGWWLDYERCLLYSAISFGPAQEATAMAIPGMFSTYEPFGTINEIRDGITTVKTQVVIYQSNEGLPGVNDPVNPARPLNGGDYDPWEYDTSLRLGNQDSGVFSGYFTSYCSARLSSMLSGRLRDGACFAFNVARNVGLIPWAQFFINVLSLILIGWSALDLLGIAKAGPAIVTIDKATEDD